MLDDEVSHLKQLNMNWNVKIHIFKELNAQILNPYQIHNRAMGNITHMSEILESD